MLTSHPRVSLSDLACGEGLTFWQGDWERRILIGEPGMLYGLVETTDNNPLVCADTFSVPSPAGTLGALALAPLFWAGIVAEQPILVLHAPEAESCEWDTLFGPDAVDARYETTTVEGLYMGLAMAVVSWNLEDGPVSGLYDEAFGRSFFVERSIGPLKPELVLGKAKAVYTLKQTSDGDKSLLTIQVIADKNGKCGAAQVVHALNVMAGYEESLGTELVTL